ncbi:MAG: DNA polymerase III subunit delta [Chloroflexota bacterium]
MPAKAAPTFYVIHGDDDLQIEETVAQMRDRMSEQPNADLNISEFDGTSTEAGVVLSAATSFPFMSDKRLVIVKDLLTWITRRGSGNTGKRAVEMLLEALPTLPEWTRLVFVERQKLPDTNKVLQLAEKHENGKVISCLSPRDSTGWIIKRAQDRYGATIEPRAAAALGSVVGPDLRRADNELLKLVSYVDGARPITEDDVALLTPYVAEASMFDMVDALAEGRGQAASRLIHRLLEQQEDVFSLFGMIVRQFRLLLLAKEHLATGGYPAGIAEAIGVHRYVAEKLARQSRNFTVEQLERIYRTLHDYDVRMKTGRIDPILAVDLLIASLTTR